MERFRYRHQTMALRRSARQLQQLIGRIERLIARGTAASSRFTTYRLAIFIAGTLSSITLLRSGQYHTGNIAWPHSSPSSSLSRRIITGLNSGFIGCACGAD